ASSRNLPALVFFTRNCRCLRRTRRSSASSASPSREIIAPLVERSVTTAGISTRELTIKDFAMEGDEGKMTIAAHLMVQSLAGSLALVACKEPLRLSMSTDGRNGTMYAVSPALVPAVTTLQIAAADTVLLSGLQVTEKFTSLIAGGTSLIAELDKAPAA
ncbi:hypothetical protein JCM8115_001595, partial [Rhodotorula mucilaginosa]